MNSEVNTKTGRLEITIWRGDNIPLITWTVTETDLTGAEIELEIRKGGPRGDLMAKQSTVSGEIILTEPAAGKFTTAEVETDAWPAGDYFFDIQQVLAPGAQTFMGGKYILRQDTTT